mgnify:CR=1 FL=1
MKIRAKVSIDYCDGSSVVFHECLSLTIRYQIEGNTVKRLFKNQPAIYKIEHEVYAKHEYTGYSGKVQYYKDCIAFIKNEEGIIKMAKEQILLSIEKNYKKEKIEQLKKQLDNLTVPKIEFEFDTEKQTL